MRCDRCGLKEATHVELRRGRGKAHHWCEECVRDAKWCARIEHKGQPRVRRIVTAAPAARKGN
jgi:hypothetical protein